MTAGEFQQRYISQIQAYRNQLGGSINTSLLRQLGVDQQILNQMIEEQVALIEAERNGIRVTDDELAQQILRDAGPSGERTVHRRGSAISSCCKARTRR